MRIILASSNAGKEREFKELLRGFEVINYSQIIAPFEIDENGADFEQNAIIKARAVFEAIKAQKPSQLENSVVLSDDSGISVEILGGAPGIFSARYSKDITPNPSEASNRAKLKNELEKKGVFSSPAFYTAAIAVIGQCEKKSVCECVLDFMHGSVIADERGNNGFGYDFMFIPNGYENTIGELSKEIKEKLSHRSKAAAKILPILEKLSQKIQN